MPLVKIDLKKGKSKDFKRTFIDSVHESMIETLKIPTDDKNIRLMGYESDCFDSKPPYEYFIEILMFAGRTKKQKVNYLRQLLINYMIN
jgi:hypothetical protein